VIDLFIGIAFKNTKTVDCFPWKHNLFYCLLQNIFDNIYSFYFISKPAA